MTQSCPKTQQDGKQIVIDYGEDIRNDYLTAEPYHLLNGCEVEPEAGSPTREVSPRMPMQECIDKVCEDFKQAASLLPAKWDNENYGRFTSVAALAMSARARIFMAP